LKQLTILLLYTDLYYSSRIEGLRNNRVLMIPELRYVLQKFTQTRLPLYVECKSVTAHVKLTKFYQLKIHFNVALGTSKSA